MLMCLLFVFLTTFSYQFEAVVAQWPHYPHSMYIPHDDSSHLPRETGQPVPPAPNPPVPNPPVPKPPVPVPPAPVTPNVTQPPKECIYFCDTCKPHRSDEDKSPVTCILPAYYFEGLCTVSTLQRCRSACVDQGYKNGKCVLSLHCSCSGECSASIQ